MKYLILSDIHGSELSLKKGLRWFEELNCDTLLLLGDILNYGPRNPLPEGLNPTAVATCLNKLNDKIIAIRGNCDSEVDQMLLDFPCMSDYALVLDEGKRIFLSHGHKYNAQNLPKGYFDLYLFGHTHIWELIKTDSYSVCNAGSTTLPKEGNPKTFALLEKGEIGVYSLEEGTLLKKINI